MGYGTDVGGLDNIKVTASLVDNVTKPLRSMLYQTKKMTKGFGNMTKNQIKTNNAMVKMRKESMLFKKGMTSMMSSLFFFKALKQEMSNLLNPAMEATGIFDIFGATLQTVFLPIALIIMEALTPIMTWFIDLPENSKLAIGAIVAATLALSSFIALKKSIDIFLFSNNIMLNNLSGIFTDFSKTMTTKIGELPTVFKIGILIALALQLSKTLKDLKSGDFNFETALWDTLSTGFLASAGASMWKTTAPYTGTIGLAVTAVVGVGFLLKSDFLSNLSVFLKGVWNEFASAWNATNLGKLKKLSTYDMSGINPGSYGIGTYTPSPATNFGNLGGSSGVMTASAGTTINSSVTLNITGSPVVDKNVVTKWVDDANRTSLSKYGVVK